MALLDVLTRPPLLPRAVERPRLHSLLAEGAEPGCLVVAPAGSGKTVAAAQVLRAAARRDVRGGWCRCAPGASGGGDLVRLVGAALGREVTDPGTTPLERAVVLLDVLGDGPVVLVVDDYEQARPEECDAVLAEVLALTPPGCRIVVCSATRPVGLIGRASVGQVRVVGADQLAFTEPEVGVLLEQSGRDPDLAGGVHGASSGWATGVAVLCETVGAGPGDGHQADLDAAVAVVLDRAGLGHGNDDELAVLSLAPAIGPGELEALGLDPQRLAELARSSALLRPVGDRWALLDLVRQPLQRRLDPVRLRAAAARVAPVLAAGDPVAAAELLMTSGDPAGAADLLAGRASAVSPDAVLPLLYRMPPEVRRRLPPLLSAVRATVEMDTALDGAEQRLASARDPRERLEAQVAVGTILVHRGQLASAAAMLESALRGAPGGAASATAAGWLALARLWAGDVDGAAAVVAGSEGTSEVGEGAALTWWVGGEVELRRGDLSGVQRAVDRLQAAGRASAAEALAAQRSLAQGDERAAADAAATAYRAAAAHGGLDLLLAAPVHAWCLTRAGRWEDAAAVADELRRRLGNVDTGARLHADLVAGAVAAQRGDVVGQTRAERAVAATRRLGYAPVEAAAHRWLPSPPGLATATSTTSAAAAPSGAGLEVGLLGPVTVHVDGRAVVDGAWRSRKAREVLLVLVLAGEVGLDRDQVVEAVWPERDPTKGRTSLRTALREVRQVLEPDRPPGEPSRFVTTRGDRITVHARNDLAEAERLHARFVAATPDHGEGLRALAAAWALFRGPFATDEAYTASLDDARRAAERLQVEVAEALVAAGSQVERAGASPSGALGTGDPPVRPEVMVAAAAHLLAAEPWRRDVAATVAAACRAAGDEVQARRAERLGFERGPRPE